MGCPLVEIVEPVGCENIVINLNIFSIMEIQKAMDKLLAGETEITIPDCSGYDRLTFRHN